MASNYGSSRNTSKFNYGGFSRNPLVGSNNRLYQQQQQPLSASQRRASKHQLQVEPPVSYRFFHRETRDSIFSDIPRPTFSNQSEEPAVVTLNYHRKNSEAGNDYSASNSYAIPKNTMRTRKQGFDNSKQGVVNVSFEPETTIHESQRQSDQVEQPLNSQNDVNKVSLSTSISQKQLGGGSSKHPPTLQKNPDHTSLYSLSESAFSSADSNEGRTSDDDDDADGSSKTAEFNTNTNQSTIDSNIPTITVQAVGVKGEKGMVPVQNGKIHGDRLPVLIDTRPQNQIEELNNTAAEAQSGGNYMSAMNLLKRMTSFSKEYYNRGSSSQLWSLGIESTLVYSHVRTLKTKDFFKEIRGKMDVEDYLINGETFIDHPGTNIASILHSVLDRLRLKEPSINMQETMDQLLNVPLDILAATMQGTRVPLGGSSVITDQSWIVIMKALTEINKRHITIIKLKHLVNLGNDSQEIRFVVIIFTPCKEKGTKSYIEIAKSFATLFTNEDFRQKLLSCHDESSFKQSIADRMQVLVQCPRKRTPSRRLSIMQEAIVHNEDEQQSEAKGHCFLFRGIREDLIRKIPFYLSDFTDGINGRNTKPKVFSAIFFLYFACILPTIAIGVVDDESTNQIIGVRKCVLAQAIAGLTFGLLGGQPLVVLLSTAPIAIYTKIMFQFSEDYEMDFLAFYSAVGIATWFFMTLYSVTNLPIIMKYCYRSVEECFALFVAMAYVVDAMKSAYKTFDKYYCDFDNNFYGNGTITSKYDAFGYPPCSKASCMLLVLLMLATFWLALSLFNFNRSPYLDAAKREILSGYALPFAVIAATLLKEHMISDIYTEKFKFKTGDQIVDFEISPIHKLQWWGWFLAFAIGFFLSVLLFIEQNVAESLVCSDGNKIQKGTSFYWDLFLLAQINLFLSLFGFPVVHGALPHSPMHVQALADTEQRNNQGVMQDVIVHVRETRVATILAHLLILLSFFYLLPEPMDAIKVPVLNGVFLFIAAISLRGNELFERLLLLFTEQTAYPPHHYVRHVPQRKIHQFTFIQIVQLLLLCGLGFSPIVYLKMIFPIVVILLMPIRQKLFPLIIEQQYLDALDGH